MSKSTLALAAKLAQPAKGSGVLEAKGLGKLYGSAPAVQGVTFTLEPGQVLGYLGPNGSGKSTTFKMLTGLLAPSFGQILYNGWDIHDNLRAYRKRLGYVPEEADLYPYLTGEEYLEMVGTLRGVLESRLRKKTSSLLQLFSLWPHRHVTLALTPKACASAFS